MVWMKELSDLPLKQAESGPVPRMDDFDTPPEAFGKPTPLDALPCGSKSRSRVFRPLSERLAARFTAVVVLPTPPF